MPRKTVKQHHADQQRALRQLRKQHGKGLDKYLKECRRGIYILRLKPMEIEMTLRAIGTIKACKLFYFVAQNYSPSIDETWMSF